MKVKLTENGEIAEVEDSWGERLIEHGKAVPAGEEKKPKAEVIVADKLPEDQEANESATGAFAPSDANGPKTQAAKKAGKKR